MFQHFSKLLNEHLRLHFLHQNKAFQYCYTVLYLKLIFIYYSNESPTERYHPERCGHH